MSNDYGEGYSDDEAVSHESLGSDASSSDVMEETALDKSRKRSVQDAFAADEQEESDSEEALINKEYRSSSGENIGINRDGSGTPREDSSAESDGDEIQLEAISSDGVEKAKEMILNREKYWSDSPNENLGNERVYDPLIAIVGMLQQRETPRMAMDRFLGRSSAQPKQVFKSTIKAARKKLDQANQTNSVVGKDFESFNRITELTDVMTGPGQLPGILDLSRESLVDRLNRIPFEYRVRGSSSHSEIRGPLNFEALKRLDPSEEIEFRRARTTEEWSTLDRGRN